MTAMQIRFTYPDVPPVDIPDDRLAGYYAPADENITDELDRIRQGIESPIGAPPITKLVGGGKKVLLISDDLTRITPVDKILPVLLPMLHQAGVRKEDIRILMALGTHRPMTEAELVRKLGAEVVKNYTVINHNGRDHAQLKDLGKTPAGTEIYVNRLTFEADLVVGMGHIVPHRVAGFTGGCKIIQPGICGDITTGQTHWLSALSSGREIMGVADNSVRREMEEIGRKVGLRYILNTVQDGAGRTARLCAGDPVQAHRAGAALSRKMHGIACREAEIVLIESFPADSEMWQAAKGYYSAELAVKKGGVVILVTPCPEGIADAHPEVEKYGYVSVAEAKQLVADGKVKDMAAAAHLAHVGRVTRDWGRGILVSPGVPPETARKIGLLPAASVPEALELAYRMTSPDAKVAVFRNGGEIMPVTS